MPSRAHMFVAAKPTIARNWLATTRRCGQRKERFSRQQSIDRTRLAPHARPSRPRGQTRDQPGSGLAASPADEVVSNGETIAVIEVASRDQALALEGKRFCRVAATPENADRLRPRADSGDRDVDGKTSSAATGFGQTEIERGNGSQPPPPWPKTRPELPHHRASP